MIDPLSARRDRPLAATLVLVLLLTLGVLLLPSGPAHATTVLTAAPDGAGTTCTVQAPCALDVAVAAAPRDGVVELTSGEYPELTVGREAAAGPITVRPAADHTPELTRLRTDAPHVTWQDLLVRITFYIQGPARDTTLSRMHFDGGGLFVRGDGARVLDSLFENGSSIDGLQISNASDVLVEGNVVRNYDQSGDNDRHSDCIQIFEADRVTIRGNSLAGCYNAGLIISGGGGAGMSDLLVEGNFIQGCVVKDESCKGGAAVDIRDGGATGVVVRSNTILNGSVRFGTGEGWVFDRNIVAYVNCDAPLTNSIIVGWNTGLCVQPDAAASFGNRVGPVDVVDVATGDLRLLDVEQARIEPWGDIETALGDHDGTALDLTLAGAHTPGGGPAPSAIPTGGGEGASVEIEIQEPTMGGHAARNGSVRLTVVASPDEAGEAGDVAATAGGVLTFRIGVVPVTAGVPDGDGVWAADLLTSTLRPGSYLVDAVLTLPDGTRVLSPPVPVRVP